jgi:hypothetical protein
MQELAADAVLVDHDRTCKIGSFGLHADRSDSENHVAQLRVKWAAPGLLKSLVS